jgi:hypothetical protein
MDKIQEKKERTLEALEKSFLSYISRTFWHKISTSDLSSFLMELGITDLDDQEMFVFQSLEEEYFRIGLRPELTILSLKMFLELVLKENTLYSIGAYSPDIPLTRFISVAIYVDDYQNRSKCENAVVELLNAFGFKEIYNLKGSIGSWFKQFWARLNTPKTQKQLEDGLDILKQSIELSHLEKPLADISKTQADAVTSLLKATEKVQSCLFQIGSILVLKTPPFLNSCLKK